MKSFCLISVSEYIKKSQRKARQIDMNCDVILFAEGIFQTVIRQETIA